MDVGIFLEIGFTFNYYYLTFDLTLKRFGQLSMPQRSSLIASLESRDALARWYTLDAADLGQVRRRHTGRLLKNK